MYKWEGKKNELVLWAEKNVLNSIEKKFFCHLIINYLNSMQTNEKFWQWKLWTIKWILCDFWIWIEIGARIVRRHWMLIVASGVHFTKKKMKQTSSIDYV